MSKPSKNVLQRYCELKERKRQLDSESRTLGTEIDHIADRLMEYLEALGKDAAKVHGFQVAVTPGNAYVAWAQEFVRVAGAEAATALKDAAPRSPKLSVTPPN